MAETRPGRRRPKRERVEGQSFMDVARQGFVRYAALEKWRELEDLRESLGLDAAGAAREAGRFPGRGPYQALWARRWAEAVIPGAEEGTAGTLFAVIEAAVAAALRDEEAERAARGDQPLDMDPEYRAYLDKALGQLQREAAGGLEPIER